MESLSSFIGIDGTNTTLNSGRIQINLKPLAGRKISATRCDPPPAAEARADLRHHALHAAGAGSDRGGSRQPHAVPIHAGRSERGRTERLCAEDAGQAAATARTARRGQRPASAGACKRRLVYDRATASRLGITPSAIDQTLYDAYGQRQVSTMFTQLNQYHVVLEVKPDFHQNADRSARSVHSHRRDGRPAARRSVGRHGHRGDAADPPAPPPPRKPA